MALALYDRVQQTGTANTTVSFTLSGSVTGYQSFSVVGNGNTTYYGATDTSGNWEVGIGTYATGGTLTRTTILASSNSGSAVTFSGTVTVFVTYPSERSVNLDANGVATIGSPISYSDTGILGSYASTTAGYNQLIVQNKSNASNASTNLNVSNDTATSGSGYAELGINSSAFSGTGSFNLPGASYLASASTDLSIGTYGAYNVHFVTNSSTTDAMTIYNSGGVSLGGQPDPGLGTLYANNVYLGFNTITAAAGTTTLTNASSGWQQVVGTTTQTIKLPVATTLYKGLAYTIANNSTGSVTITDSAGTTLDTTVTGGSSILVLTNNSTSAGSWTAYSYVPSSYDFSTSTANFGNASITNAVWNGTTIASGYGGTGLTTFSAANNALYSTSSSALAAGTLPVAAGGTGATTLTSNGVVYGNGTSAVSATSAGTTGQVLIATTGSAPSWGSVPSTAAVTSFSAGTTGLTPSTGTTGAVTLAGTLNVANGGTGTTTSTGSGSVVLSSSPSLTTPTLGAATGTSLAVSASALTSSNTSNLGVGGTLGFSDTGIIAHSVATTNGYLQQVIQNKSAGTAASAEFIAYNDSGTATTNYATFGINSSGYTGTGAINTANYGYFITGSTDIVVGTAGANNIHLVTNSQATDALTVNTSNAVAFNGSYGTSGYVLQSNGSGSAPSWVAPGGSTTLTTTSFTATAGQTSFTVTYTPALLQGVYRNGIKLDPADYTSTSGTAIVLSTGAVVGDNIQVQYFTSLATTTAVNSISFGSTGLTPSTATSGAVTVAGTLAVANGGTGQTTASAAFNALSPITSTGDLILGNGVNSATRLGIGTNGQVLTSNGTTASWAAAAGATITGTTTSGTYYVVGTTSTSGSLTTASISNTNAVSYNASTGALTAVSHVSSSDERLKSNIQTLTNAVQTVENLRGVSYLRNDKPEIGVVAQEVEKILPMLVQEDPEGYKTVAYGNMVGLLIEAVKELSAEVKTLKAELNK
jgi:trimeric autotransporter adhesin